MKNIAGELLAAWEAKSGKVPTVHALFLEAANRYPERTFIHRRSSRGEWRTTWAEARSATAENVRRLTALGLRRGDRVVAYADDVVAMIHFILACSFAGVVFVPIAPSSSTRLVQRLVERTGAKHVFTTSDGVPRLLEAGIQPITFVGADEPGGAVHPLVLAAPGETSFDALTAAASRPCADEYAIIPTSGSTGEPKLAIKNHAHVISALELKRGLRFDAEKPERMLFCSSLLHGQAQTTLALGFAIAAELVVPEGVEAAVRREDVLALAPTIIRGSPRIVKALHAQHIAASGDPNGRFLGSGARIVRTSGAPIPREMLELLAKQGMDVGEISGSTETDVFLLTPYGEWHPGYVGKPVSFVELRLAEDGEIEVRTPAALLGYLGDEEASAAVFTPDGFIRLGDLGEVGADGFVRIVGRKKEVLNTPDGTNVHAVPIEEKIAANAWVDQVVLVGDQRPFIGALIVVKPGVEGEPTDGYLAPDEHPELYARAMTAIAELNTKLEPIEQVKKVALFGRPMPAELIDSDPKSGKIKKARAKITAHYAARIDALYA